MLRLYLRPAAPRRRGKAGCPLVEYGSWMAARKKVKGVTCPRPLLFLASFCCSIFNIVDAYLGSGGLSGFPVLALGTGLGFGLHAVVFFLFSQATSDRAKSHSPCQSSRL